MILGFQYLAVLIHNGYAMGKALYRKHRSKSFDEVIGQAHITETLKHAIEKGSIAHAYLFTGPRGVGKTSIARILAHAVNDIPYTDESTHLDIIEIDAASNRRIDEIRELRDKVHVAPTSARYKVYIIDEVHMLTREAFNALLKTLEEPPEHAIFILATTEAHKIPDTIISRTQRFTFKPIDTTTAIGHLKSIAKHENIPADDAALELIARHGKGSFRDSISMLDQLSGLAKDSYGAEDVSLLLGLPGDTVISDVIQALVHNDVDRLFDSVRTMKEQGVAVNEAAIAISAVLREQIMIKSLQLEQQITLTLLKELLQLTAGNPDYTALELILLGAVDVSGSKPTHPPKKDTPSDNTVKVISQPPNEPNKAPKSTRSDTAALEHDEPAESTSAAAQSEAELSDQSAEVDNAESVEFDTQSWNTLLDDIKSQHNTLYGVLRMAQASSDGQIITLRFAYGFHKKRIDSPQNSAIVRKYIKKHFGSAEFATTVSKNELPSVAVPAAESKPISDTTVSSVSNIFGGAELLES